MFERVLLFTVKSTFIHTVDTNRPHIIHIKGML
jgi:hypothetical protein